VDVAFGAESGSERRRGEESYLVESLAPGMTFLGVADGFGSLGNGILGAPLALALARDYLRRKERTGALVGRASQTAVLQQTVVAALGYANSCLFARSGSNDDYIAGGIAIAAALVIGNQLFLAHVGDARVYIVRGERIEALTHDDAVVMEEVPSSVSSLPATFMSQSLLWRSLGTQARLEVGATQIDLQPGDRFLFCTSGIHRRLSVEQIAGAILPSTTAAEALASVWEAQHARGDEGGAAVIAFDPLQILAHRVQYVAPSRRFRPTVVALLVTIVAIALLVCLRMLHPSS
jgi:serine/threonine protein phosphatase PrpC